MMRKVKLSPRNLLPLMIVTAMLMLGVRIGGLWDSVTQGVLYSGVKKVQAAGAEKEPAPKEEKKTDVKKPEEKPAEGPKADAAKPEEKKTDGKSEAAAPEAQHPTSKSAIASKNSATPESDLYKQLMGRREQLDKRAQELDAREVLAVVAEKRIDQKIKEMEGLRTQLMTLVGQAGEAQQAQIENLVKIYEIMKPKEAAKIFESLDMPILLGVIQKMKPARTAAVLAEMNPEKAKEITTALTKKDQLPEVK